MVMILSKIFWWTFKNIIYVFKWLTQAVADPGGLESLNPHREGFLFNYFIYLFFLLVSFNPPFKNSLVTHQTLDYKVVLVVGFQHNGITSSVMIRGE